MAHGNIMIVDDNPANLRLLEDMLLQKGHEVHSFPVGRLALAEAVQNPPDLILLDINMPEMNGYEVCQRLKSDERLADIPVIFLSALSEIQDKVKAFGSGGVEGLGLGNGRQKMLYLPYAHTDFIFPVIGEELGLRVTLIVVFCYLLIVTSGILISLNAKDRFGMLLGFGCTAILGLQAAVNIGVTTSLLPNKGLPLPFISYGGSNLFFCLICIGILINIYRQGKEEKTTANTEMMVRVRHVSRM